MRKTSVVMFMVVAVLMLATCALADAGTRIRATVPFAFYVGEEQLPAGSYVFELRAMGLGSSSSSAVAVCRQDGSTAVVISSVPAGRGYDRVTDAHLHFTRYSDSYFLNKVEGPESGASLRPTKVERELGAQNNLAKETVILAQRRASQAGTQ